MYSLNSSNVNEIEIIIVTFNIYTAAYQYHIFNRFDIYSFTSPIECTLY